MFVNFVIGSRTRALCSNQSEGKDTIFTANQVRDQHHFGFFLLIAFFASSSDWPAALVMSVVNGPVVTLELV